MANYVRVGQLHYQGKIISSSGIIADVRRHRRARGPENIRRVKSWLKSHHHYMHWGRFEAL